jgi:PAS domain-containing protein
VTTEARTDDWYAEACRRARAHGRRRRAAKASTDWPEFAPPVALSEGPLGSVQAADREIARQTALRARAVAAFAATRPAAADRAQGEPGAMSPERWSARPEVLRPVSEWAGRELMIALSISAQSADALLTRSLILVQRLPGTLAALESGALHPGHLWTMLEKVAPIADDRIRAEVEAELLRWAAGRVVTPPQLAAKARREVLTRDVRAAARQLQRALKERGVHLQPHTVDGMATVTVVSTMPEAQALYRALTACAQTLDEDDDPRTGGQKMVDCLLDLVLRPGESDLPPVQVLLTIVASISTLAGGDAPGEIDGHVVPAEMIRQFLVALTARSAPMADHAEPTVPQSTGTQVSWQEREQDELSQWWAEMERRVLSGELVDPEADLPRPDPLDPMHDLVDGPQDEPEPPPQPSSAAPDGRWAAADRAVDDASLALFRVRGKLTHAQRMVRAAAAVDDADEAAWQAGPAGRITDAEDAITALLATTDTHRELLAELLTATEGGGLADRPRIALTDALTGALLALTQWPDLVRAGTCGDQRCRRDPARCSHDLSRQPGLGPPGATDGYRPSAELDRWMRARDRRCRFPGCRRRVPRGGELDHHRPYPAGPTSAGNLAGYCTTDHRGKHQAPGWRHQLEADGTLTVTTPTGLVAVTTPPPY